MIQLKPQSTKRKTQLGYITNAESGEARGQMGIIEMTCLLIIFFILNTGRYCCYTVAQP